MFNENKGFTTIKENDDNIFISIKLPNMDKKDIQFVIKENSIQVKAEKKQESRIQKKDFYKHEQSFEGLYRIIPLPVHINANEAKSKFEDGILKLKIPKKKSKKKIIAYS